MTIKELSTVFHASVYVNRYTVTGIMHGGCSVKVDTLYEGKLAKLTDESILGLTIKSIENIPGSTLSNGIPFLKITVA